jgi:hypothetical protein
MPKAKHAMCDLAEPLFFHLRWTWHVFPRLFFGELRLKAIFDDLSIHQRVFGRQIRGAQAVASSVEVISSLGQTGSIHDSGKELKPSWAGPKPWWSERGPDVFVGTERQMFCFIKSQLN